MTGTCATAIDLINKTSIYTIGYTISKHIAMALC